MADRSAAKTQKRLSVWSATEPLPVPLPPPPRVPMQSIDAAAIPILELHGAQPVSPDAHVTKPVATDDSIAKRPTKPQTLRSPGVVASFAITAIVVAVIGRVQMHDPKELNWPTVKAIVLGGTIEPVIPESELPYVTGMPLILGTDQTNVAESETKPILRVTMSEISLADPPGASDADKAERR